MSWEAPGPGGRDVELGEVHTPSGDAYRVEVGGLVYEVLDDARATVYRLERWGQRRRVRSRTQRMMVLEAMEEEVTEPWWRSAWRWLAHRMRRLKWS